MAENREKKINIVECTLRDGSYAIDYQFTTEQTKKIVAGLEKAGVKLIEIGHGLGLNGSPKHGLAAATDEEYIEAAASVIHEAQFGMFCIPGIARLEDLDMAAKHGMGFVRVGTNVTEVEQAKPFIKKAKDLGMFVSVNLMKSYALPAEEFLKKALLAEHYGSDVVAVVDSAGGMLPTEVARYVSCMKECMSASIGFHGHNNLLLAVANTISAVQAGATYVDTTLQGMGRSVGNAQTDVTLMLLERMGYRTGINFFAIMDLGDMIIRPLIEHGVKGIDSLSATLGYAQFHSSYLKLITSAVEKYGVDSRSLVIKVSEVDRVTVTEELINRVAQELKESAR